MYSQINGDGPHAPSNDVWLTMQEATAKYKICRNSLRTYTNDGRLRCFRVGGNNARRFLDSDLQALLNYRPTVAEQEAGEVCAATAPRILAVCRVSTPKQQQSGDLSRQVDRVLSYCQERWPNGIVEKHVAVRSGLNFDCDSFRKMIEQITSRRYQYLVVLYKERLARVAFSLLETVCKLHGVEIVVIEQADNSGESNQEMIEDLLAITHVYSCRIYSRRGAKAHFKSIPESVVEEVRRLTLRGHSQRFIYSFLEKAGKNTDVKGKPFSVAIVRKLMRATKTEEVVKIALDNSPASATAKRASFATFASERLRFNQADRTTQERKILAAYLAHCKAAGLAPESKRRCLAFLSQKCPAGTTGSGTAKAWKGAWLLRDQARKQ